MKYDVFISYSRKDYVDENKQVIPGNVISQIKELFDSNGISYWFDEEGVFSGDAFAPVIARNIKASKIFLFISSENSNASEWTSNEIATAHAYKKKIIPFRYDDSVYNDSVIIYIARLDYIEYHKNASRAFPRLLSSVQVYLKAEEDKKEKERQEEERRRNDEISRQERAVKLQGLRERIETLENRKFDIEKEILTQEKSLADLRNEKRIIEANIKDLQEEEACLLGHNREIRNVVVPQPPQPRESSNKTLNFFAREWAELKSAMALKHWVVNLLTIIFITTMLFVLVVVATDHNYLIYLWAVLACCCAVAGGYSLLKNNRIGWGWLLMAAVFAVIFYVIWESLMDAMVMLLLCLGLLAAIRLVYLIRKNGVSAFSIVKKGKYPLRKSILSISLVGVLLTWIVIEGIVQEVKLNNIINQAIINDLPSTTSVFNDDILDSIVERHPFRQFWDLEDIPKYRRKLEKYNKIKQTANKEAEYMPADEEEVPMNKSDLAL